MHNLLWGDEFTENPANTLKTLLHRLRSMLNELEVFSHLSEVRHKCVQGVNIRNDSKY